MISWSSKPPAPSALLLLPLLVSWSCAPDPAEPSQRFPLAEEHGVNPGMLADAYREAERAGRAHSLLVERHGVLISEGYFRGYDVDSLHQAWSVTKSFTSTLVGIAIDRGFIQSVHQTLSAFLGSAIDDLDEDKGNISLRHLLTMSCGIPWVEEPGEASEFPDWVSAPDQISYILNKPLAYPPGERFDYSDGSAHLVSVVLSEATGMSALEFAREHLFDPLGMGMSDWWEDNRGYSFGGVGLRLRARDMVALGRLFLDGGVHQGRRIVSEDWIRAATATQISTNPVDPRAWGYGYFWWNPGCGSFGCYMASGFGGQLILVVPALDLVMVTTTEWNVDRARAAQNWSLAFDLLTDRILPAVH